MYLGLYTTVVGKEYDKFKVYVLELKVRNTKYTYCKLFSDQTGRWHYTSDKKLITKTHKIKKNHSSPDDDKVSMSYNGRTHIKDI
jgi:hypothetical protein